MNDERRPAQAAHAEYGNAAQRTAAPSYRSLRAVLLAAAADGRLHQRERVIAAVIAEPTSSQLDIVRLTGLHRRTVRHFLDELETASLVVAEPGYRGSKRYSFAARSTWRGNESTSRGAESAPRHHATSHGADPAPPYARARADSVVASVGPTTPRAALRRSSVQVAPASANLSGNSPEPATHDRTAKLDPGASAPFDERERTEALLGEGKPPPAARRPTPGDGAAPAACVSLPSVSTGSGAAAQFADYARAREPADVLQLSPSQRAMRAALEVPSVLQPGGGRAS